MKRTAGVRNEANVPGRPWVSSTALNCAAHRMHTAHRRCASLLCLAATDSAKPCCRYHAHYDVRWLRAHDGLLWRHQTLLQLFLSLNPAATAAAGIMPITTYGGFKRMTGFCKTRIPADIAAALEKVKDNDEAVRVRG